VLHSYLSPGKHNLQTRKAEVGSTTQKTLVHSDIRMTLVIGTYATLGMQGGATATLEEASS
jgi:hypothetical protein